MRHLIAATFLTFIATTASAADFCLVKSKGGEALQCFKTQGQCESKADRMNGWTCEKR